MQYDLHYNQINITEHTNYQPVIAKKPNTYLYDDDDDANDDDDDDDDDDGGVDDVDACAGGDGVDDGFNKKLYLDSK